MELTALRKDGSEFPMEVSVAPMRIHEQWHAVGIIRDITERKQAEDYLRESEGRFYTIFETSPESILLTRLEDGRIVDLNESHTRITGFTREDVIGKTAEESGICQEPAERQELVEQLRKTGSFVNWEIPFRTKEGVPGTVLASGRIMVQDDVPHIITMSRDITDLKKAQKALRESEERYRSVVENSHDGICMIGDDYRLDFANEVFLRHCWLQPGRAHGKRR